MKTHFRVVYSDIIDKPISHLPITARPKFRTFSGAYHFVKGCLKQNRTATLFEMCSEGIVARWEYEDDIIVFDCNEELCKAIDALEAKNESL